MAWVSSRSDTGVDVVLDRPSKEGGLNNVGQVNPKDATCAERFSALQGGDIQVVNLANVERQGPACHLTNV